MPPIRVLVALPAQEPLRESALAFQQGRASTIPLKSANIPALVTLDESFSAVPIGSGGTSMSAQSLRPGSSAQFVVRGTIEAKDAGDVPSDLEGKQLFADPFIEAIRQAPPVNCGGGPVGSAADVRTKLGVAALAKKGLDGTDVAIAIMDTGINRAHVAAKLGHAVLMDAANSWVHPAVTTPPGAHPVEHGSMCAYDALLSAPKATLLDFPILTTRAPGAAVMSGSLGNAIQAYSQLLAAYASMAPGGVSKYKALVISNSWGMFDTKWDFNPGHPGRYCDNPRHPFSLLISVLVASNVDILFAAGNCGADCPDGRCGATTQTIMGANAHPEVLTLAGCDTKDVRVGYSSQGPSITGMYQQKPDITSYTQFLGSEAFGAGVADGGTSAACPVAAGVVAAIRTKQSNTTTPPANLFAQLRADARQVGWPTGWNGDLGFGIINPIATALAFGL